MTEQKITRIIIEGPDCSGKSTVVDRVKNMLRWDAKALHHKPGNQFKRYLKEYAMNDKIVFDRSHFSEIVYSMLWRGGNPFSDQEMEVLDRLSRFETIIIFTCPPVEVLKKRFSKRDFDQQIKLVELEKSKRLFSKVLSKHPHIIYESKDYEELERLLEKIKRLVKNENLYYSY